MCDTKEVAKKFWGSEGNEGEGHTETSGGEQNPDTGNDEDVSDSQFSLITPGNSSEPLPSILSIIVMAPIILSCNIYSVWVFSNWQLIADICLGIDRIVVAKLVHVLV